MVVMWPHGRQAQSLCGAETVEGFAVAYLLTFGDRP